MKRWVYLVVAVLVSIPVAAIDFQLLEPTDLAIDGLAISDDGDTAYVVFGGGWKDPVFAEVWDLTVGHRIHRHQFAITSQSSRNVAVYHGDETYLIIDGDETVIVDPLTGTEKVRLYESWNQAGGALAISPDGAFFAVDAHTDLIRVARIPSGEILWEREHGLHLQDLAVSRDGRFIASVGRDATLKIWDVANGWLLRTITGIRTYGALGFSPDRNHLYVTREPRWLDLRSGEWVAPVYTGSDGAAITLESVSSIGTSGNTWLYQVTGDRLFLWDGNDPGEPREYRINPSPRADLLVIATGGTRALFADENGTVHLWDLDADSPLRAFTSYSDGRWASMDVTGVFATGNN